MSDKHMQRQINLSKAKSNKPLHNIQSSRTSSVPQQQSASRRAAFDIQADSARRMSSQQKKRTSSNTASIPRRQRSVSEQANAASAAPRRQRSFMESDTGEQTPIQAAQSGNAQIAGQPRKPMTAEDYYRERQKRRGTASKSTQQSKHKRKNKKGLIITGIVFAIILALVLGLWAYYRSIINTGDMGTLDDVEGIVATPPELRNKQLNLLVLGIDYTTEDADIVQRDPIGQTDMILYCRFDFENNTLKMMQIPRDTCVGEVGGAAGRINGVFANAADTNNRVAALAKVIGEQYGLSVDNYLTIDMESLRYIVDVFGGIKVYVAETMDYDGSHIDAGWQNLDGAACEFFLRNRKQYATGDIQRLANQRYFYSALFSRLRTATWQDIVKLMPLIGQYVNTDLSLTDLMAVCINMLQIPSSNIMICQLPTSLGEFYGSQDVLAVAKPQAVELFNQYFNDTETPVTIATFDAFDWPARDGGVSGPNVQWMNAVDADGANADGATEDSILAAQQQAAAEAAAASSQAALDAAAQAAQTDTAGAAG